jgi:hypothetical protein
MTVLSQRHDTSCANQLRIAAVRLCNKLRHPLTKKEFDNNDDHHHQVETYSAIVLVLDFCFNYPPARQNYTAKVVKLEA